MKGELENLFFAVQDLELLITAANGIQYLQVVRRGYKRFGVTAVVKNIFNIELLDL